MPTFDDVVNAPVIVAVGPPGLSISGLACLPRDEQTAIFPVGVWAAGNTGVQGISLSNAGDTIIVPGLGPAGVYGAATTSPGVIGWSKENDGCQGFSFTGTAIRAASFFGPGIDSLSGALTGVRGVSDVQDRPSPPPRTSPVSSAVRIHNMA
jgi:hypothetical protein